MDKRSNKSHGADPHSENSQAIVYFELIENDNENVGKFKCKICGQIRNGAKRSNLVSHLKCVHKDIYLSKVRKQVENIDMRMEIKRMKLLQNCVELVTINKQPFTLFSHSGFQKIMGKKLKKLQEAGYALNLEKPKVSQVKDHIHKTAQKIREKISSEMKDRLSSLSADVVTKNNTSFFGAYIQYIFDGALKTRCGGIKGLHDRHWMGKYFIINHR